MDLRRITGKTGVVAHRGAAYLFPENTMTAFRKAETLGVDAIELDVRSTRDGVAIVIHDPDLNRVAGVNNLVSDMTYEEVSGIRLLTGDGIPDLESVLNEIKIPILIELKTKEVLLPVVRLLGRNSDLQERCMLISFDHDLLKLAKERIAGLFAGALFMGLPADPVQSVKKCGADFISVNFGGLTREYVDNCHRNGIVVNAWTPNTEGEISRTIATGVDSITSDRPDMVLRELENNDAGRLRNVK